MRSVFDDHVASTLFADNVGYFILNLYFLQFCFRCFDCCIQIRIEVSDDHFPVYGAFLDFIQQGLHICGEALVHDLREGFLHNIIDNLAKFGNIEVFIFFYNISSAKNRCNSRSISTRTSDAKFLQCFYQRCLGKVCRWLCKMLLRLDFFFGQL